MKKPIIIILTWLFLYCGNPLKAERSLSNDTEIKDRTELLHPVSVGSWSCCHYFLNYNSDIEIAEESKWFSLEENEDDWINGEGPFSNDFNQFLVTEWPSHVRPILIRRHFSLDPSFIKNFEGGSLLLKCSYDENPKVYLNGEKIWETEGWNDNDYAIVTLDFNPSLILREGDNVMAVSLPAGEGGGHIDFGLYVEVQDSDNAVENLFDSNNETSAIYNLNGITAGYDWDALPAGIYITKGNKVLKNE